MNKRQYKKKIKKMMKQIIEIIDKNSIPLKDLDPYFGIKLTRPIYTLEVIMEKEHEQETI